MLTAAAATSSVEVAPTPIITIVPANSNASLQGNFTLVMADADVVGTNESAGQTRHWLVNDVTLTGTCNFFFPPVPSAKARIKRLTTITRIKFLAERKHRGRRSGYPVRWTGSGGGQRTASVRVTPSCGDSTLTHVRLATAIVMCSCYFHSPRTSLLRRT